MGHGSTPILTCSSHRGDPPANRYIKDEEKSPSTHWTTSISPPSNPSKVPSSPKSSLPARALALVRPPTPPHGFARVAACLKTLELVEVDQEMPVGTMSIGMVLSPGLSSVSSSCVVKDDTTGLVYLDTVMTSIGWIVLGSSEPSEGPIIEDITKQL